MDVSLCSEIDEKESEEEDEHSLHCREKIVPQPSLSQKGKKEKKNAGCQMEFVFFEVVESDEEEKPKAES